MMCHDAGRRRMRGSGGRSSEHGGEQCMWEGRVGDGAAGGGMARCGSPSGW